MAMARLSLICTFLLLLSSLLHASPLRPNIPDCKRVLWFMAVGKNSNANYKTFVANAIISARIHAPSLVPHLIYDGDLDGFTDWVEKLGGKVCHHQLSFYPALKMLSENGERPFKAYKYYPPYMRLDVPNIVERLNYNPKEIDMKYVLYTDVDVLFEKDLDSCSLPKPKLMLVGPELYRGVIANTGVMYMNVPAFKARLPGLLNHGFKQRFNYLSHDQGLILEYFKDEMQLLTDEYNWKAYWGYNPNAVILHFHGPKPSKCIVCFLQNEANFESVCDTCPALYLPLFQVARTRGTIPEFRRFVDLFNRYKAIGYYKDYAYELPKY